MQRASARTSSLRLPWKEPHAPQGCPLLGTEAFPGSSGGGGGPSREEEFCNHANRFLQTMPLCNHAARTQGRVWGPLGILRGPMGRVALLCSALLCSGSLDWALCLGAGWLEASRGKAGLAGKITWYLVMAKSWGVARGDLREFHFGEVKRHDFSPFVGLDS